MARYLRELGVEQALLARLLHRCLPLFSMPVHKRAAILMGQVGGSVGGWWVGFRWVGRQHWSGEQKVRVLMWLRGGGLRMRERCRLRPAPQTSSASAFGSPHRRLLPPTTADGPGPDCH